LGVIDLLLFGGTGIGALMASFQQRKLRYFFAAIVGGCVGYFAAFIAANLEDIQFYTIRRWVTGKSVLMEIVHHPADRWTTTIVVSLFVFTGASFAMLIVWRFESTKTGGGTET
jgi:hypothetical protein